LASTISFSGLARMDYSLLGNNVLKDHSQPPNPVVRGLVAGPEDWRWGSCRSYAYGEAGLVRINDGIWWEEKIRQSAG
jgi:hypothetical protein